MEHIHNCGNCAHFNACDEIMKRYAGFSGISKDGLACVNYAVRIEDILGDDYDLDRLRELVEADRGGRCVVLPVKPGGTVRFAKNPRAKHETVDAITIYSDGEMSFGFHEYGMKTEWVDRWSEDNACNYVSVEAAEAALKGEQDD